MIDWSHCDTVILDMDGTVLDLHFDNRFWMHHLPAAYAAHHGLSEADGRAQLFAHFQAAQGTLQWYCIDYWSQHCGFDVAALKPDLAHLIRPRADALAFLDAVKASGRALWLATNAHRASLELKQATLRFSEAFDVIVSAHDYGYPKEDVRFWQALQAAHPFEPARTLFCDDSPDVLAGAAAFGIGTVIGIRTPDSQQEPRVFPPERRTIDQFAELGPLP